ncbi:MAG TPA: iron-containing redox enzyme family protein [Thermoanaerobaculia bacterium]|nr:iron-containing redox enzyme family protein [Thermoanaerobaculia bacterium]
MSKTKKNKAVLTEKRALELIHLFSQFPPYPRHGLDDPHLATLITLHDLPLDRVIQFFNAWRPLSAHQPQILYLLTAAFPEQRDRKRMNELNIRDEDGYKRGHQPHVALLDHLIVTLGGTPVVHERTEKIMNAFHDGLWRPTTAARSAGLAAGIEHVAMQISRYFREVVRLSGFPELVTTNPYLAIHVVVEPQHIADTHEIALRYMEQGFAERAEVLAAFEEVLTFWANFWNATFEELFELPLAS